MPSTRSAAKLELRSVAATLGQQQRRLLALMPQLEALPGYRACEERSRAGDLDAARRAQVPSVSRLLKLGEVSAATPLAGVVALLLSARRP